MRTSLVIWNPIRNGYPEKQRGFYIVSIRRTGTPDAFVSIAEWKDGDSTGKEAFYLYQAPYKLTDIGYVVEAWAELPEPWREEKNGCI